MLHSGAHDINSCRIDAAVTKDIRQFCDVLLDAVERAGKQLSEVVREDLAGLTFAASQRDFI